MSSDISDKSGEEILTKRGYMLVKKLGEGGYSKVYLSELKSKTGLNNVQVACKVINMNKTPKKFLTKFLPRELAILSKVSHPHIISILSIYQYRNYFYIFMRYAEKGDLLDYILKNGATTENQARIWGRQIALGVQYLHILDIGHRDLKCENILLTKNLNCKIADFGFARQIMISNNLPLSYELSNTFCGSVSYAPPEIIHGELYNPKISDIWSLGVIIYTILNKANPFNSKNLKLLYQQQMSKNWKFRSKYQNTLSNEIKELLIRMLEPNPSLRIKIEDVINSSWIAMNTELKSLNYAEYNAFKAAMDEIQSTDGNTAVFSSYDDDDDDDNDASIMNYNEPKRQKFSFSIFKINESYKQNSITFFKKEES